MVKPRDSSGDKHPQNDREYRMECHSERSEESRCKNRLIEKKIKLIKPRDSSGDIHPQNDRKNKMECHSEQSEESHCKNKLINN